MLSGGQFLAGAENCQHRIQVSNVVASWKTGAKGCTFVSLEALMLEEP